MTSANVVRFYIYQGGKVVGEHREHALCKARYTELLRFSPAKDFEIRPWGLDEEEEYWEGDKEPLDSFLRRKRVPMPD